MSHPVEGLLLVDKPSGPTSHDIVDRIRRITGQQRVGHAGTLDPMASGLLPILLGTATRLVRYLPHSPKVYEGSFRLGLTTTTDDLSGDVLARHGSVLPSHEDVKEAAARLRGRLLQVPPAVSARKVGGKRLYRLAREGQTPAAPAAQVEILRFDPVPTDDPAEWTFLAEVSGGTYIRALARDLGSILKCGGALSRLRRLAIGPMSVATAVPVPPTGEADCQAFLAAVIPPEDAPLVPPAVVLAGEVSVTRFLSGSSLPAPPEAPARDTCRVLDEAGRLLGIAEVLEGRLQPRVVLRSRD